MFLRKYSPKTSDKFFIFATLDVREDYIFNIILKEKIRSKKIIIKIMKTNIKNYYKNVK